MLVLPIPSVFSCVFTEEKIASDHTGIKHSLVECCSDVCPSVGFLLSPHMTMSSIRVTIRFLITMLTKAFLHQLLRRPALGRVLGCSKHLHYWIMEATCFCEPSMQQNVFFLNTSPDVRFDAILSLSYTGSFFHIRAWSLLYAFSTVRPFIKTCAFPNHIHSIEFATG